MAAFREISNIVDRAIQNQTDLWIRYRNLQSAFSEEIISPFEWIDEDKTLFQAHCLLRSEDSLFNVFMIVEAHVHENVIPPASESDQDQPESEQVRAAVLLAHPVSRLGSEEEEVNISGPGPISRVETPVEWHRLMFYYHDCMRHERLAQMFFPKQDLFLIALERQQIIEFFQHKINLQFTLNFRHWLQSFRNFLNPEQHPQEILCLGTSFFCLDGINIAPLLFTPIKAAFQVENQVQIQAEEYGINTAPLAKLGLNAEETAQFLKETGQYIQGHPQIDDIEAYLQSKLSALYSFPVKLSPTTTISVDGVPENTIFNGTGLFWLKPPQDGSAFEELVELSKESHWNSAPDALLSLLNPKQSSEPQPVLPPQENPFLVSSMGKQQRNAAAVALKKPVTVVTGPAGSGKSQVLLNTLLQAYLEGKTVLVTSPSKQIAGALYDQLCNKLEFPGVLWAGTANHADQTARRIDHLIAHIQKENVKEFQEHVLSARQVLAQAEDCLEKIQDLRGKEVSYQNEVREIERLLPKAVVKKVLQLSLPYDENEKQLFLDALSKISDQVRALVNSRLELQRKVESAIIDREHRHTATKVFKEFEDRWGTFGGDALSFQNVSRLEDVINLIKLWLDLLSMLEARHAQDTAQARLHDLEQKANRSLQKLTEDHRQRAIQIAKLYRRSDLVNAHKALGNIKTEFEKRMASPRRWSEKLTSTLKNLGTQGNTMPRFSGILLQFGWPDLAATLSSSTISEQFDLSNDVTAILRSAILLQKSQESREIFEIAQAKTVALTEPLPARIRKDISKLDLTGFEAQTLQEALTEIKKKADTVLQHRLGAAETISQLITQNNLRLQFIQRLQEIFSGPERAFFKITEDAAEHQLEQYLRIWRRMAWLWELHNIIQNITDQKPALPDEDQALLETQSASEKYLSAAQDFLNATWMDRAAALDSATLQGAIRYNLAVQEESQLTDRLQNNKLSRLKDIQQENFAHILRLFPIWVACTTDIPDCFPLKSELFDLAIIDQAPLVSIPSGISLLYRAKSLLIAGDPLQQPYLPQLNSAADQLLYEKHSVDPMCFSYSNLSLFHLAQNGTRQSVVFLSDHYRSDPRIATFISKEFYDHPLRICTNLVKHGYSREQVNHIGGIYWVNIKGTFQRNESGSAYNFTEQEHIQELVGRLLERRQQSDGSRLSIAIISPFRAQALRIKEWVELSIPTEHTVRAGTPQEFQDEECDIVIFSPVISSGMPKEALEGIETSTQMLNLALSRAKISVIIAGDWNFCNNQLPTSHSFHHLARYAKEKCRSVVDSLSSLAVFGGPVSCAAGYFPDAADTEHSRTTLEQLLLSCRDQVFWIDAQFDPQVIDLLDEVLDREKGCQIKDFRLLTAEKQVNPPTGKPILRADTLLTFEKYLANKGIQFNVRTVSAMVVSERSILADSTGGILLPQFNTVYRKHRQTNEYSVSRATAEGFNELWGKAAPIEPVIPKKV